MVDLIGLTNAITDVMIEVTDEELGYLGLKKGFYNRKANISYDKFLQFISSKEKMFIPAGSPANVVYGASYLGLYTALIGTIGNDVHGKRYIKSLEEANIIPLLNVIDGPSGICYILVSPDGERSSVVNIGVAEEYSFDLSHLEAKIFHTSAYELRSNPEKVKEAIHHAKNVGTKTSFDLSDPDLVKRTSLEEVLNKIDILFTTEQEATELIGDKPSKALKELSKICPVVIMKKGKKGSVIRQGKTNYNIPVYKIKIVNTNGAGDAYAAGFLFGLVKEHPLEECGHIGSKFAARVCGIKGSHL